MPNLFRIIIDTIIGRRSTAEGNLETTGLSEMSPSGRTPDGGINTPTLTSIEPETIYDIPRVFDILNGHWISLKLTDARLCGFGVFSNVYYGKLIEPEEMEVAIKKVWPKKTKRNDEMLLLASFRKLGARNVAQLLYTGRTIHGEGTRNSLICETFYMTYQESNLDQLIRSEGTLDLVETKLYSWQLFNGLDFLAMNNIMHRDVKPVNILINRGTGELQLADFGSAKLVKNAKELSTGYQVTRYYRPPELLYSKGMMVYDWRVDLWSAGCVVAEMLSGKVLFASRNVKHQRTRTQYALGIPSLKDVEHMGVPEEVVVESMDLNLRSIGVKRFLREYNIPSEAIRFLSKLFVYNPRKRPHGEKAMTDQFFDEIYKSSTRTSTGLSTSPLLQRQNGPAKRPYDFEGMLSLNRRTDTPIIPTPAVSSPSDASYSDGQVLCVSPLDNSIRNSQEEDQTPIGMRSASITSVMGKNKQNKQQSIKSNNHTNDSSRNSSGFPPSPFEINAESDPSTSDEAVDDTNREEMNKLFPWRSSSQKGRTERDHEMELRLSAASIMAYSNPSDLLPMLKKISILRDQTDPLTPIMPPLLLGALTKLFAQRAANIPILPLTTLPYSIQQRIGHFAKAIPQLRLVSRATLNAVTDDVEATTSDCPSLKELSILAKLRNRFLDRAKIRKNRLFDSNWFSPKDVNGYQLNLVIGGKVKIGCEDIDMDYYFTRHPENNMKKRAELRWSAQLSKKGLPLWVYEIIRPQFTLKFKTNYEPGDQIQIRIGLDTRHLCKDVFVSKNSPKMTRLNHHILQYEIEMGDLPVPVLYDGSHAGPLDLGIRLIIPPIREDIIIYDIDLRCSIPDRAGIMDRLAEYEVRREVIEKSTILNMKDIFFSNILDSDPSSQAENKLSTNNSTSADKELISPPKIQIPKGKSAAKTVAGRRK